MDPSVLFPHELDAHPVRVCCCQRIFIVIIIHALLSCFDPLFFWIALQSVCIDPVLFLPICPLANPLIGHGSLQFGNRNLYALWHIRHFNDWIQLDILGWKTIHGGPGIEENHGPFHGIFFLLLFVVITFLILFTVFAIFSNDFVTTFCIKVYIVIIRHQILHFFVLLVIVVVFFLLVLLDLYTFFGVLVDFICFFLFVFVFLILSFIFFILIVFIFFILILILVILVVVPFLAVFLVFELPFFFTRANFRFLVRTQEPTIGGSGNGMQRIARKSKHSSWNRRYRDHLDPFSTCRYFPATSL
mmetsp:Transcript_31749/g.72939  ORF Transcript_31749/g.72939 Transcript_31749/m.72939 type:complete len:302 (+) Transcript_31749:361-1266(+)